MILSEDRGVQTVRYSTNQQLISEDINFMGYYTYQNTTDILAMLSVLGVEDGTGPARVLSGLLLEHDNLLDSTLRAGAAVSFTGSYYTDDVWGFQSEAGKPFLATLPVDTTVSVDPGGAQDRIDIVEVRPLRTALDTEERQFKDPITGIVTGANSATRYEYSCQIKVLKGTEGASPSAPATESGWIKVAEVYVSAGASSLSQSNIKDVRDAGTWNTEPDGTLYRSGGDVFYTDVTVHGNILPGTDSTYDIGASGNEWANAYIDNIYGTIQTAAQTNITSVGTLTSLSVSGNLTVGGNAKIDRAGDATIAYIDSYVDTDYNVRFRIFENSVVQWNFGSATASSEFNFKDDVADTYPLRIFEGAINNAIVVGSAGVGIGTDDIESWSTLVAIEGPEQAVVFNTSNPSAHFLSNAYYDGVWKYKSTDEAQRLSMFATGEFQYSQADSGTVDTEITWTIPFSIAAGSLANAAVITTTGVTMAGTLNVTGAVTGNSTLYISGGVDLYSGAVGGGVSITGSGISMGNNATITGTLDVTGAVTIGEQNTAPTLRIAYSTTEYTDISTTSSGQTTITGTVVGFNAQVGINRTDPEGILHVQRGSDVRSSVSSSTLLTIEQSTSASLEIITGTSGAGSVIFSDADATNRAKIEYRHDLDRLTISSSGNIYFDADYFGFGALPSTGAIVNIEQTDTGGGNAALRVEQADVSEAVITVVGTAAASTLTQTLVAEADVTTATREGFIKFLIFDDGNQITDANYFVPFYSLS